MTSVVNVKVAHIRPQYQNLEEWMNDPNNIYIGRKRIIFIDGKRFPPYDSKFANPYKINIDGNRETIIAKYEKYIRDNIDNGIITKSDLLTLKGKTLGCWCKPHICHGDILIKIISDMKNESDHP